MTLDALRAEFAADRCRHVVVPGVLDPDDAASLRDQVDAAGFAPYDEPDRGRYERNLGLTAPALFEDLRAIGEQIVARPLVVHHASWRRLRHRDYQLIKDDGRDRPLPVAHLEITLDFSAAATGQAELVYSDGQASWVVPQLPGAVAVVEREPWLYRYARYLNLAVGDAVVHRLHLTLAFRDAPAATPEGARPGAR